MPTIELRTSERLRTEDTPDLGAFTMPRRPRTEDPEAREWIESAPACAHRVLVEGEHLRVEPHSGRNLVTGIVGHLVTDLEIAIPAVDAVVDSLDPWLIAPVRHGAFLVLPREAEPTLLRSGVTHSVGRRAVVVAAVVALTVLSGPARAAPNAQQAPDGGQTETARSEASTASADPASTAGNPPSQTQPTAPTWGDETQANVPAPRAAAGAIPDSVLAALIGKDVFATTAQGAVEGRLIAFDAANVSLNAKTGQPVTIPRAHLFGLKVVSVAEEKDKDRIPGTGMEIAGAIMAPLGVAGIVAGAVMTGYTSVTYALPALAPGVAFTVASVPLLIIGAKKRKKALESRRAMQATITPTPIRTRHGGWGGGLTLRF
jgi:hypothetical protein